MIRFEVLESPSTDDIHEYAFYFPKFFIGRSKKCHFYLKDSYLEGIHMMVECRQGGVQIKNVNALFYYINGKKIVGERLIQVGDIIEIGQTSVKLTVYSASTMNWPIKLEEKYDRFYEEASEYIELLEAVENELEQTLE
jgi:pSer/pThr/pTyr-binding forkhead associated (FHA) protein